METTFADFAATQQARNDIQLKITEHCLTLCDKLMEDFEKRYSPRSMKFELDSSGRKYHKIWHEGSCHAFIDKKTGEVYKPASYKAPAKIVRYRLLEIASREECFNRADWAGSYLYVR